MHGLESIIFRLCRVSHSKAAGGAASNKGSARSESKVEDAEDSKVVLAHFFSAELAYATAAVLLKQSMVRVFSSAV